MSMDEFIQEYLKSLGASETEIRPYPALFYKLTGKKGKPRLFENPVKLFLLQSVLGTIFWGGGMWLFFWQFQGEEITQLYAAIGFGVSTGAIFAITIKIKAKRLKLYRWDKWLQDKGFNSSI